MARRRKQTADPLITDALEAFKSFETHEHDWRQEWGDDLRFYALDQWPERLRLRREAQGKACLVMDETTQYVRQVVNEIRLNPPAMHARPVDDKADIEVAEALQGLFRHIEEASRATSAYKTAAEWAAVTGRGFFRVYAQSIDGSRNLQEPRIGRIANALSVYFDEFSVETDGSDASEAFVIVDLSPRQFKAQYPGSKAVDFIGRNTSMVYESWLTSDYVRIAEWHRKERDGSRTIVETDDGDLTEDQAREIGVENYRTRSEPKMKVVCRKITAVDVLDEWEFPSEHIGIVPVYGNERFADDKRKLFGMIRAAKDPQRLSNYVSSNLAEAVVNQARSPWVAPIEAIEDLPEWDNPDLAIGALRYRSMTVDGQAIPAPQRVDTDARLPGFVQLLQGTSQRIQAALGQYQAAVGAPSNEKSGKAIVERKAESDVGTYHYTDNLSASIQHGARILMQMIPRLYDTPRVAAILGEDGVSSQIAIDPNLRTPIAQRPSRDGRSVEKVMNPNIGKYDVIVTTGPSFSSKRQEAAATIGEFVRQTPGAMEMFGDLWLKNLDFPGAQEMAKRARKMLPQQLSDDDEGQAEIPEHIERMIRDVAQMVDQRDEVLQAKMGEIAKAAQDARKEVAQARVDRAQAQAAQAQVKAERERLAREMDNLRAMRRELGLDTKNADLHIENAALRADQRIGGDGAADNG